MKRYVSKHLNSLTSNISATKADLKKRWHIFREPATIRGHVDKLFKTHYQHNALAKDYRKNVVLRYFEKIPLWTWLLILGAIAGIFWYLDDTASPVTTDPLDTFLGASIGFMITVQVGFTAILIPLVVTIMPKSDGGAKSQGVLRQALLHYTNTKQVAVNGLSFIGVLLLEAMFIDNIASDLYYAAMILNAIWMFINLVITLLFLKRSLEFLSRSGFGDIDRAYMMQKAWPAQFERRMCDVLWQNLTTDDIGPLRHRNIEGLAVDTWLSGTDMQEVAHTPIKGARKLYNVKTRKLGAALEKLAKEYRKSENYEPQQRLKLFLPANFDLKFDQLAKDKKGIAVARMATTHAEEYGHFLNNIGAYFSFKQAPETATLDEYINFFAREARTAIEQRSTGDYRLAVKDLRLAIEFALSISKADYAPIGESYALIKTGLTLRTPTSHWLQNMRSLSKPAINVCLSGESDDYWASLAYNFYSLWLVAAKDFGPEVAKSVLSHLRAVHFDLVNARKSQARQLDNETANDLLINCPESIQFQYKKLVQTEISAWEDLQMMGFDHFLKIKDIQKQNEALREFLSTPLDNAIVCARLGDQYGIEWWLDHHMRLKETLNRHTSYRRTWNDNVVTSKDLWNSGALMHFWRDQSAVSIIAHIGFAWSHIEKSSEDKMKIAPLFMAKRLFRGELADRGSYHGDLQPLNTAQRLFEFSMRYHNDEEFIENTYRSLLSREFASLRQAREEYAVSGRVYTHNGYGESLGDHTNEFIVLALALMINTTDRPILQRERQQEITRHFGWQAIDRYKDFLKTLNNRLKTLLPSAHDAKEQSDLQENSVLIVTEIIVALTEKPASELKLEDLVETLRTELNNAIDAADSASF